jgi:hypothetical protein
LVFTVVELARTVRGCGATGRVVVVVVVAGVVACSVVVVEEVVGTGLGVTSVLDVSVFTSSENAGAIVAKLQTEKTAKRAVRLIIAMVINLQQVGDYVGDDCRRDLFPWIENNARRQAAIPHTMAAIRDFFCVDIQENGFTL